MEGPPLYAMLIFGRVSMQLLTKKTVQLVAQYGFSSYNTTQINLLGLQVSSVETQHTNLIWAMKCI